MYRPKPKPLFDATAAGSTLTKTLWPTAGPGVYTCTLPGVQQIANPASILNSGLAVVGGVVAPNYRDEALILDFAAVGSTNVALVVEIGKLPTPGGIAFPIAQATLTSIVTSGTIANVNPFNGDATAGKTWNLFDGIVISTTGFDLTDEVIVCQNGSVNNNPSRILLTADQAQYYYVMITTLNSFTEVLCCYTQTMRRTLVKTLP